MLMYLQMFPFYGFNVFVVRNNDCSGFLLKKKVKQSIWILWRCLMRYDNPIKSKLRWNYNPVYCSRWCLVATLDLEMFWTRLPWKLACFHAPAKFVFSFWSLRTIYAKTLAVMYPCVVYESAPLHTVLWFFWPIIFCGGKDDFFATIVCVVPNDS